MSPVLAVQEGSRDVFSEEQTGGLLRSATAGRSRGEWLCCWQVVPELKAYYSKNSKSIFCFIAMWDISAQDP